MAQCRFPFFFLFEFWILDLFRISNFGFRISKCKQLFKRQSDRGIMAGHSHWSKIKRAKGATDAKRGKVWSKVARKIIIAAKNGGDPRDNLSLRYVIEEAKGV